ncbi:hypothetical protein H696_05900 [Fonticula alba]|uniref:SURF1-like protein n=1 Tax=Fonticula alba TaxID=691883 RepID=A0A058Z111_FONAL|nr:hypothetical protein H696_05900 [Fonticula alba]KCV67613.1 hypothetical protein H696_05900 [Fonticula alba]|eukprot:XP_009497951.1 hypothetical protein H696_05900 [Fonticula alba]
MVNRGWIPHDMKDPKLRSAGNPTGPVDVIGMLRHPIRPSSFTPDNVPEKGQWHWIDVGQLADTLRADPIVIDVTDANFPGGLPMADQTTANIRNNHLSYAVTWYMLSASTAAMIFLL